MGKGYVRINKRGNGKIHIGEKERAAYDKVMEDWVHLPCRPYPEWNLKLKHVEIVKDFDKKELCKFCARREGLKKPRLTVGYRARILTLKEKPAQGLRRHGNEGSWRRSDGGREVLLVERGHDSFSVMLLGKGIKELKRKDPNTIVGQMAWVPEDDMVLVDMDLDTNLDFIDWYQNHEEDFCPDCYGWFPDRGRLINGKDAVCPNGKCDYTE